MKVFYDHLILREEIVAEISAHDLDVVDRQEILDLIDETFHHHTLNLILTHLPKDKHRGFIMALHQAPHDAQLLAYLKREIKADIEAEIRKMAHQLKAEIMAEVEKSKKKITSPHPLS